MILSLALLGCSGIQAEEPAGVGVLAKGEVRIDVLFDGDCPRDVSATDVLLSKKNTTKVVYQSVDINTLDPVKRKYFIIVDPFKKGWWESDKDGAIIINQKPDDDAPTKVLYKYTITNGNPTLDCPAVDPYWRVL